ncbi:uncharacterized protein PGTG_22727 [Puccinia graminis f. sp. tritici CRL 75-36-700-3]|uniref:Uncharacterized protein n=1 Tax=Puccinia graminis f. sp. tritici (strain CRL 75-36-700-3 / race SCCL) TaxID=418459 RepID=H6QVH3_PUCGT|nr:uncharacterized protein PGTG_22727 [Puccinia graminis f. sp. tritici CRL 75-36-700-3]EHS62956.1 hypothetical protein PGTG_22727 [Puccinia graminis f. sp. tritici CRL 75-36-700-3]
MIASLKRCLLGSQVAAKWPHPVAGATTNDTPSHQFNEGPTNRQRNFCCQVGMIAFQSIMADRHHLGQPQENKSSPGPTADDAFAAKWAPPLFKRSWLTVITSVSPSKTNHRRDPPPTTPQENKPSPGPTADDVGMIAFQTIMADRHHLGQPQQNDSSPGPTANDAFAAKWAPHLFNRSWLTVITSVSPSKTNHRRDPPPTTPQENKPSPGPTADDVGMIAFQTIMADRHHLGQPQENKSSPGPTADDAPEKGFIAGTHRRRRADRHHFGQPQKNELALGPTADDAPGPTDDDGESPFRFSSAHLAATFAAKWAPPLFKRSGLTVITSVSARESIHRRDPPPTTVSPPSPSSSSQAQDRFLIVLPDLLWSAPPPKRFHVGPTDRGL